MKQFENGIVLVQAAEDFGGFVPVKKVQGAPVSTTGPTYRPRRSFSDIPHNENMYDPREPNQDPREVQSQNDKDLAMKQRAIHAAIAQLRQKKNMSFQAAWQKIQSTRPELFQGLQSVVVHPD